MSNSANCRFLVLGEQSGPYLLSISNKAQTLDLPKKLRAVHSRLAGGGGKIAMRGGDEILEIRALKFPQRLVVWAVRRDRRDRSGLSDALKVRRQVREPHLTPRH